MEKGEDKPVHVTNDVWNWFNTYWDREDVKNQSTKNAVNRQGKNGNADLKTHNNGSRSLEMTEDELTKKANSIKPDLITLMEITHTNKKTKEIDNKRVACILTNAKRKVQCRATQLSQREEKSSCSVPTIEINKIIFEEATTNKGVIGLGTVLVRNQEANSAMTPPTQQFEQTILVLEEQLKAEIDERKKMQEFLNIRLNQACCPISYY